MDRPQFFFLVLRRLDGEESEGRAPKIVRLWLTRKKQNRYISAPATAMFANARGAPSKYRRSWTTSLECGLGSEEYVARFHAACTVDRWSAAWCVV